MKNKIEDILEGSYTKQGEFDKEKALNDLCVLFSVSKCDNTHCVDGVVDEIYGEKIYCSICEDK